MVILYLTCADAAEAAKIGNALLEAKLVACVRQTNIQSTYWWDGKIQSNPEVLLMMESLEETFSQVQDVVTKLHSYDEYVLTMVPVQQTTPGVEQWLADTLNS